MTILEQQKAEKLEALKKESEYIELFNAQLNKVVPSRTKKEYNKDNEEQIKEKETTL